MFVQVITGRVEDAGAVKERFELWQRDFAPRAEGFLGSTGGVTADGRLFVAARFSSAESAQRNSDRPEQGAWWQETSKLLADVQFANSTDLETWRDGGSDDAGFVQVIRSRIGDRARFSELNKRLEEGFGAQRPEVIGGVVIWHPEDRCTEVVYFASEAAAREGEKKELPPELSEAFEEVLSLTEDPEYYDLSEPWLFSPR